MSFALSPPLPSALERRYDGPIPALAPSRPVPGLIQKLAAESREHGARRRVALGAAQAVADPWLRRHAAALADYRALALSVAKAP
ncbi:MAG: hypothetical protein LDL39_11905 [Magnetospirillum sp.]|nr:hypothetical protein [Magnetospirillum sp.]